jgi:hypothetical protein
VPDEPTLTSAEARLVTRFAPPVPLEVVRSTLAQAYDELRARSTVTTYIGILAERLADRRLGILADELRAKAARLGVTHTNPRPPRVIRRLESPS